MFFVTIIILIGLSFLSIGLLKMGKACRTIKIKNIQTPDDTVLSYIMTYIIPIATTNRDSVEVYIVHILLFILIGYVYLKLNWYI